MRPTYWIVALIAFAGTSQASSPQFMPETGMYGNPQRTGEGAFVEVQGNTAAVAFFTHTGDGDSTFYTAAGALFTIPFNEQRQLGYYPATRFIADLYKTVGGPILGRTSPGDAPYQAVKVGRTVVEFGYLNELTIFVEFDAPLPPGVPNDGNFFLKRLTFGFGTYGRSAGGYWCWPDLRGEWVLVDQTDQTLAPERFLFSAADVSPAPDLMTCPNSDQTHVLRFVDERNGAELRCVRGSDPTDGTGKAGCELKRSASQQVDYWFGVQDVTPTKLVGSKGEYRAGWARTEQRAIMFRVP